MREVVDSDAAVGRRRAPKHLHNPDVTAWFFFLTGLSGARRLRAPRVGEAEGRRGRGSERPRVGFGRKRRREDAAPPKALHSAELVRRFRCAAFGAVVEDRRHLVENAKGPPNTPHRPMTHHRNKPHNTRPGLQRTRTHARNTRTHARTHARNTRTHARTQVRGFVWRAAGAG